MKQTIPILLIVLPASLFATTVEPVKTQKVKNLAIYHTVKGNIEKEYNTLVEKKLKSIGFRLTDAHKRVNDQYESKYGSTVLDVLSFMPMLKDSAILPLLNIDPRIAGFTPFNLVIHKKIDENVSYIGHIMPETMLDILGIENKDIRKKFTASFKALDATIAQELDGYQSIIPYKKLSKQSMIYFEYAFDTQKDIDGFIKKFQNKFELTFIDKGYLIAGFYDFMDAYGADKILTDYDAFWTYSLSHLDFSYNIFDKEGARPQAALFAPSSMYMYIKKGSNKIRVGMLRLQNWSDTLDIKDPRRLELIEKLDNEIPQLLTQLGMKSVHVNTVTRDTPVQVDKQSKAIEEKVVQNKIQEQNATQTLATKQLSKIDKAETLPTKVLAKEKVAQKKIQHIKVGNSVVNITLPTVPSVIQIKGSKHSSSDRSIKFSKRTPPNYKPHSFDKKKKEEVSTSTRIGEVIKGKVSAHLRGAFMEVAKVKETLEVAGFEVITSAPVNKDASLISVVFTDKSLITMASKSNRGFMASLRVLIDTKEKTISITNPTYMAKGFLQEDFDEKVTKNILTKLIDSFPNLTNSKDTVKFQLLPKYQFMKGMPRYENMIEVASGTDLLEKIKDNKRVLFTQTLDNGATLIGVQLSKRTNKFTKRIGRNNAAMLPYPILIENGKAMILDPKFYISYMYPKLSMSEFMTIATVPDAMIKDCEKVFKKKK